MRNETILGKFGIGHRISLLAYWLIGLLAYWLIGLLAYWLIGLLAYCGLLFRYFIVSTRKYLRILRKYNQYIYLENYIL
jgi:predicted ferric reductase